MFKEIESRNEFNEIVKEERLTVVDFFATWCEIGRASCRERV